MAQLTAHFSADFSSFYAAIQRSEVELKKLDSGAKFVQSSLSRMTDTFSGRKLIQEAILMSEAVEKIGGKSKLTEKELESLGNKAQDAVNKLHALGDKVPEKLQALADAVKPIPEKITLMGKAAEVAKSQLGQMFAAFTAANLVQSAVGAFRSLVTNLIDVGKQAISTADNIVDLSDKLGVSTKAIQEMDAVAKETGSTVEAFASAAFKLGIKLSGGSDSVESSVKELGLSLQTLQEQTGEDAFRTTVLALGKIEDANKRNALGVSLFGKSFEAIAAGVAADYDKIAKAAGASGDAQIRALELVNQAWKNFKDRTLKGVIDTMGSVVIAAQQLVREFESGGIIDKLRILANLGTPQGAVLQGAELFRKGLQEQATAGALGKTRGPALPAAFQVDVSPAFSEQLKALDAQVMKLTASQRAQIDAALAIGASHDEITNKLKLEEDVLKRYITLKQATVKSLKDESQAARDAEEAWKPYLDMLDRRGKLESELIMSSQSAATKKLQAITMGAGVIGNLPGQLGAQTGTLTGLGIFGRPQNIAGGAQGGAGLGLQPGALTQGPGFFSGLGGGMQNLWRGMSGGQGFGGVLSNVGGGISQGFGQLISGGLTGLIGKGLDFAVQGIGKLVGKLFGGEGKATNRARDEAISQFTGISGDKGASQQAFRKMATEAGVTSAELDKLFSTKRTKDFEAAMESVTGKIEAQQALFEKYAVTWADFEGPEQTKRFAEELAKLTDETKALEAAGLSHESALQKQEQSYIDLALAAVKAGEEMTPALAGAIKQLAEMGRLTESQAAALLGLSDSVVLDFQRMEDVAKKYGIEVDKLGPKFEAAKLGATADETIKDFEFLVESGADINAVLQGMSDEFQNIVKKALQFGITLPDAMRPVLEQLLEQGKLTDASGVKLEDLSEIKFAPPLEEAIQGLIDKMSELIDKIGGVGAALNELPDGVNVGVTGPDIDPTTGLHNKDYDLRQGFQGGTHGKFLSFGAGTPAMLHGRERVVTEAEGNAEAAGWGHVAARVDALGEQLLRMTEGLQRATRDNLNLAIGQRA